MRWNRTLWLIIILSWIVYGFDKRDRFSGLYKTIPSSTMGKGNLFLSLHGRAFLWDNNAARKSPTFYPNGELGWGMTDFAQLSAGFQILTTKPGQAFVNLKLTLPNNKNIRFFGMGGAVSIFRNLTSEFKSNGFRYKNEGFSPDFFLMGNEQVITYYKALAIFDIEAIRISSYLPFKFYLNAGVEWAIKSWMNENVKEAREEYKKNNSDLKNESYIGTTNFSKLPMTIGAELKTQSTDFFVELESEPFIEQIKSLFKKEGKDKYWTRYNIVLEGTSPYLKTIDIHLYEAPIFINLGGRLKYPNGTSLHGGISWLLSKDMGATIGPCVRNKNCMEGASDGYSPFFPQWRIFGGLKYPLKFQQTSAELYRAYLLRKNRVIRKVIDIDFNLKSKKKDSSTSIDYEQEMKGNAETVKKRREAAKNEKLD